MNSMNILYSGDRGIEAGLYMSMISIANRVKCPINVYVLTMDMVIDEKTYYPVSEFCIKKIEGLLKSKNENSSITLIDATRHFAEALPEKNTKTRFTPGCMLRLFSDLEPLPDKILYLDNDVICLDGLALEEMYETDVTNLEFAGVLDHYGSWFFRRKWYKRDYINSGVLLLNMKKIKETGMFERCRQMLQTTEMFFPDQGALNKTCGYDTKSYLPRRFNEQRRLRKNTVLLHFTTSFRLFPVFHHITVKPWNIDMVHEILKYDVCDEIYKEYKILAKENENENDTTVFCG